MPAGDAVTDASIRGAGECQHFIASGSQVFRVQSILGVESFWRGGRKKADARRGHELGPQPPEFKIATSAGELQQSFALSMGKRDRGQCRIVSR